MTQAHLVLADGTIYSGTAFGASGTTIGEVVFNTGMTGYQEILTDPSYAGQLVSLTYPIIGNYGVNPDDFESRRVQVSGFIVKELADAPSNWRSVETLDAFLKTHGVVGIAGLDTRALTQRLRSAGGCPKPWAGRGCSGGAFGHGNARRARAKAGGVGGLCRRELHGPGDDRRALCLAVGIRRNQV